MKKACSFEGVHFPTDAQVKTALATMRMRVTTSVINRAPGGRLGYAGLCVASHDHGGKYRTAAMQRVAGRGRMLMTASTVQQEHAKTDSLDQKALTRQKG